MPVYLEATPEDTELRLLKGLRRRFSTIPDDLALPDVLAGDRHVIDVDGGRVRTKAVGTDADFQTIVNRTGQRQGLTRLVDQLAPSCHNCT